jgi:drug/metabolite transporter (DMT)-like permease
VATATALALGAALLHASWNLAVKTSGDRPSLAWAQFVVGGLAGLPLVLWTGFPHGGAWPFLAASALVHVLYVEGLLRAYHHGDFSFAYPLARGGGAVSAALLGAVVLGDSLPAWAWAAIAVVAAGLASTVRRETSRPSISWAVWTAVVIGTYTVIDAAGARHAGASVGARVAYGVLLTLLAAAALSIVGLVRGRGQGLVSVLHAAPVRVLLSGIALTAAYTLVLVAVSIPGVSVGYVATLRESSVVLAALAGWLLLHERLGRARLASSCVVVAGMVGLVVVR